MSAKTPSLEETIRRRKRTQLPRAPEKTLGERMAELKGPDEKLQVLLEEMVRLAERQTIFTLALELHQISAALWHGGYTVEGYVNIEQQLAPGATAINYVTVPPNWVFLAMESTQYSSLPWWLTIGIWIDNDPPALPFGFLLRAPDYYKFINKGLTPIRRFFNFTATNNHAVDTANYCVINLFSIMTETTWDMVETVFVKPIIEFIRERAEKETGRPFP